MAIDPLWLEALSQATPGKRSINAMEKLARATSPEAARWAFLQLELRERARTKFGDRADQMLFTREALEQSTSLSVARYRASRFPAGDTVADLTCSIGADLIALAGRGPTIGFDLDDERLTYARHNLEVFGRTAEIHCADSLAAEWSFDYAFADPARRIQGKRTLEPQDFAPNPLQLADRMKNLKLGAIKLSPMLQDSFFDSLGGQLEFWSYQGECREAVIWLGSETGTGRNAIHIESEESLPAGDAPYDTDSPDAFIYAADPAAIRAHCLGTLCDRLGLVALGDSNGYLTGSEPVETPWLTRYRVIEHLKGDIRAAGKRLAELDCGNPVIKLRSKHATVANLQKAWRGKGKRHLLVFVWDVGASVKFTFAEQLS